MAAPSTAPSPPLSSSEAFSLVAKVVNGDLSPSIQGWTVTSYHTGAGQARAVLRPDYNRTFFEHATSGHDVFSLGGTPPFPEGVQIDSGVGGQHDTKGRRTVSINAGTGTSGVRIASHEGTGPMLYSGEKDRDSDDSTKYGQFYACNADLLYGPAVALFYHGSLNSTLPQGCVDVDLLPKCVDADPGAYGPVTMISCYPDV
ncbi:uncharacterized protein K452DRAFT_226434 [Aplosporella prunicola CBS 121167]|uniref:DUF7907 domain-containing protein n=1 Tax=Aplosporella prunicola CBS 121167 TaxID=1176127 RepID=A0A6A6BEI6_9PEZI|nr:uncharacterized protein K452DRAFT_226434 [Aplosporella prunicola CBS 121167]KAF2142476.1 hypothetical protein K452DRAFT_226434 [Aplosporella prunicola CBS 121167]